MRSNDLPEFFTKKKVKPSVSNQIEQLTKDHDRRNLELRKTININETKKEKS